MDVRLPDGTVIRGVPDGITKAELTAKLQSNGYDVSKLSSPAETSTVDNIADGAKNLGMGFLRGAKDVVDTGAQLLSSGFDKLAGTKEGERVRTMNQAGQADFKKNYGDSTAADIGRVGGNIAATLPVGPVLGGLARAGAGAAGVGAQAAPLVNALSSAGFRAGATNPTVNMLTRAAGGGVVGGASAGLVDPESAGTGAAIGAALPPALAGAGRIGQAIGKGVRGSGASPEVSALATRAGELGIDIPADRLVDSKPLNALASSLNYVPFSGRAATETKMQSQLNKALSRTFGQDSDNVTGALRKASDDLGGKFDKVLSSNTVKLDEKFLSDLAAAEQTAIAELGADGAGIIRKQIEEIINKGANGQIDGQAAYNIKKTLDRIGKRNSPEAFYASDLRRNLMDALNRSLSPEDAAAFATTRKQYGNMLSLEKLAQNGAEGDISIGRLANLKNINNRDLQELADISAQFLKSREGNHGAMQRTLLGGLAGLSGVGAPALAVGAAAGRGTNALLNSNAARNFVTNQAPRAPNPGNALLGTGFYRSAPLLAADE